MQISAKTDYAVRALLSLAARETELVKIDTVVTDQRMPRKFVEAILGELRRAGLVRSQRGADGGYALARPANDITLGAVIRAVDGPLAEIRGLRPNETTYSASRPTCPTSGSRCVPACAKCSTRPRSHRCSAASCPPTSGVWSRRLTRGCRDSSARDQPVDL